MRGRLLPTLLAVLATLGLGAGAAPATTVPVGWSITPGGPFTGAGGPVEGPFRCESSQIAGMFDVDGNSLGFIDEITYDSCVAGSFLTVEISTNLPWLLRGVSHANGLTNIDIDNMGAEVSGPGCRFEVAGSAAATYDNATSILTVRIQAIEIIYVDPSNDCLGLISAGEYVSLLSSSYVISPATDHRARVAAISDCGLFIRPCFQACENMGEVRPFGGRGYQSLGGKE